MLKESESLIESLGLQPFWPLPFVWSGKAQTIAGTYWPCPQITSKNVFHEVIVSGGDRLVLCENTPFSWTEGDRIACLVHGLTGCYQSNYMIRMTQRLLDLGIKVFRVNLRGCGPGFGKAQNPYHIGISEDTRSVLEWLAIQHPRSPVTGIGFSLGANILLKMLGEDGELTTGQIDSMIAISPPVDVRQSALLMASSENKFFNKYFANRIQNDVRRLHTHFPELGRIEFPNQAGIIDIDNIYTAPKFGFRDAEDYYIKTSSFPLLASIRIPTLIIGSIDDPVVAVDCLARIPRTSWIEKVISQYGGHVGFIGYGGNWTWKWSDDVATEWLKKRRFLVKADLALAEVGL